MNKQWAFFKNLSNHQKFIIYLEDLGKVELVKVGEFHGYDRTNKTSYFINQDCLVKLPVVEVVL